MSTGKSRGLSWLTGRVGQTTHSRLWPIFGLSWPYKNLEEAEKDVADLRRERYTIAITHLFAAALMCYLVFRQNSSKSQLYEMDLENPSFMLMMAMIFIIIIEGVAVFLSINGYVKPAMGSSVDAWNETIKHAIEDQALIYRKAATAILLVNVSLFTYVTFFGFSTIDGGRIAFLFFALFFTLGAAGLGYYRSRKLAKNPQLSNWENATKDILSERKFWAKVLLSIGLVGILTELIIFILPSNYELNLIGLFIAFPTMMSFLFALILYVKNLSDRQFNKLGDRMDR